MGFNTTILVLNDALSDIQNDPDFGKNLVRAISKACMERKSIDVHAGCHVNAATVIESHHADQKVAVLVGGNCGEVLGGKMCYISYSADQVAALKQLAASMGYRLVKQKK